MAMYRERKQLLIIGHGLATRYLLEAMAEIAHSWKITVIGAEPEGHYNRIQLSPLLAGETTEADLLEAAGERHRTHVDYRYGVPACHIDAAGRTVRLENGDRLKYDALVLATGARPAVPAVDGIDAGNVFGFRTLADTRLLQQLPRGCPVVVIGGGLLGIEAATGLAGRGHSVHLLHRRPVLMNQQLDSTSSEVLAEALIGRGIKLHLGVEPAVIATRSSRVSGVVLQEGFYIPAEGVVCATGIVANTELARSAQCAIGRGVVVDEGLATSVAGIYALGECCEFQGRTYGLVAPIREQAKVLAGRLAGGSDCYRERPFVTRLKVSGLQVHCLGEQPEGAECIIWFDRRLGDYRRLWLQDNRLVGALLMGDVSDSDWYLQLLRNKTDIRSVRTQLSFGAPWCERAA